MAAALDVVWTTVFADGPAGGNPCPVVFAADDMTGDAMQALAAEFGHETAFVLAPRDGGDARLRFFVPAHEMEMCVHATVAAVALLAERGVVAGGATRIETPLAVRDVTWEIASQTATVELPAPELGPVLGDGRAELLSALGLGEGDLADGPDRPVQVVSTARPKLMVPLCDEARLDALEPDHPRLWEVCEALGATGVYAFVAAQGLHLAARQFPVRAGYVEDAATGVAASALAGYLLAHADRPVAAGWRTWTVAQGRAMGRPSVMEAGAHIDAGGTVTATRVRGRMRRMTAAERAAA